MTPKQKQFYLDNKGLLCPFCKSSEIQAIGTPDISTEFTYQLAECVSCHQLWRDVYTLVDIHSNKRKLTYDKTTSKSKS